MKRFFFQFKANLLASSLCFAILFFALPSHALTVREVALPRLVNGGWVMDKADILSDSTEAQTIAGTKAMVVAIDSEQSLPIRENLRQFDFGF